MGFEGEAAPEMVWDKLLVKEKNVSLLSGGITFGFLSDIRISEIQGKTIKPC